MTQDDSEANVRQRIRGLRLSRGWSLDTLAARCHISASTLSRIETGNRRIALDQLVAISRALGTTLDQLVEPDNDDDVIIRPEAQAMDGATMWLLSHERDRRGVTVAKLRLTPQSQPRKLRVHTGYEWFTVLSGVVHLQLGERSILVHPGQAAEFSTLTLHAIEAHKGPSELLIILDHHGEHTHLSPH